MATVQEIEEIEDLSTNAERKRCAKIVRDRMVDDNRNQRNDLLEQIAFNIESP